MQLVGPGIAMYDPASGDREERRIGPEEVVAYFGDGPDKVVDIQALAGDSTDNVPGAPGIGIKTAAQLIAEYGDLDTLLARAGEIKQAKRRETLTNPETVELVRPSKKLVTLVRDVKTEAPLEALGLPKLDGKALIAFLKAMDLTTITRRVGEICGVDPAAIDPDPRFVGPGGWRGRNGDVVAGGEPAPAAAAPVAAAAPPALAQAKGPSGLARRAPKPRGRGSTPHVQDGDQCRRTLRLDRARLHEGVVAVDTETSSLDSLTADLVGVSLCVRPGEACTSRSGIARGWTIFSARAASRPARSAKARRSRC